MLNTTCLSLFQQEVTLVQFVLSDKPILYLHETIHLSAQQNLNNILNSWVKTFQLRNLPCTWLLAPDEYQLMLIDALNVNTEELIQAVRWRIKDLLTFSLDDAAIDVFTVPPCGQNGQYKKQFVVASRISHLQPTAHTIQETGLKLNSIDISELNLHYLLNFLEPEQDNAVALLVFHPEQTQFVISKKKQLYLARNFNFDLSTQPYNAEERYENIWLELQRSFDFCESQLGFEAPRRVLIAPTYEHLPDLIEYLNAHLAAVSAPIQLAQYIETRQPWPNVLPLSCFRAISAGFKQMSMAHDAAN